MRLLMVGDSACGKTSLVLRFDQNVFSTKFVTTIGVDYRDKMVKVCFVYSEQILLMAGTGKTIGRIPEFQVSNSSDVSPFFLNSSECSLFYRSKAHPCAYNFGILLDKNAFAV